MFTNTLILDNLSDLLSGKNDAKLFNNAEAIRQKKYGDSVYIRGVIDMSNYCSCNCKFCGNASSSHLDRFRLSVDQIIESISQAYSEGIDLIHLASGVDAFIDDDFLTPIVEYCKDNGIDIEMAIGIKNLEIYESLISKGVNRFIIKFETSNKNVFERVKQCHSTFEEYIDFIKKLNNKQVNIGSGNIIGLPFTTGEDLQNDIKLLKELDLDMVSTSVFKANKESIFYDKKDGDKDLALRFIAIMNLLYFDKNISIPSNSSYGIENKIKAMRYGANVLSVNYTNRSFEKNYSIYEGGARIRDNLLKTKEYIKDAGMKYVPWHEFKEKN